MGTYTVQTRTIKMVSEQTDYIVVHYSIFRIGCEQTRHMGTNSFRICSQNMHMSMYVSSLWHVAAHYADKYSRVAARLDDTSKGKNGFMCCYGLI